MEKSEFRTSFGECVKNLDWVAGFFDGEGCIYYNPSVVKTTIKGKSYSYPEIQVILAQSGDKGRALLEAFQTEYGFGKITSNHGSSLTKQVPYLTRMSGKKALLFLQKLEPHLRLKQDKAKDVMDNCWEHFFGK